MNSVGQRLSVVFILLLVISLGSLTLKPTNSQTIPKLSVPEFDLGIFMVSGGLEIGVQNQYVISNGHDHPWIFYDFRYKWSESENWHYSELDPSKEAQYIAETGTTGVTRIVVPLNRFNEVLGSSNSHQLDMQIRAINGYSNYTSSVSNYGIDPNDYPAIVVNASDWSQTRTIKIPESSILPSPSPFVPEFTWLTILPLFIFTLSFLVLIKRKWVNVNCYGNDKKRMMSLVTLHFHSLHSCSRNRNHRFLLLRKS